MKKEFEKIMPWIRKTIPNLIAEEIAGVQPISDVSWDDVKTGFLLLTGNKSRRNRFGTIIHSFIEGWLIYDGCEFVTLEEFINQFPDINCTELVNMKGQMLDPVWVKRLEDLK